MGNHEWNEPSVFGLCGETQSPHQCWWKVVGALEHRHGSHEAAGGEIQNGPSRVQWERWWIFVFVSLGWTQVCVCGHVYSMMMAVAYGCQGYMGGVWVIGHVGVEESDPVPPHVNVCCLHQILWGWVVYQSYPGLAGSSCRVGSRVRVLELLVWDLV